MCGRMTFIGIPHDMLKALKLQELPPIESHYNITPSQQTYVIRTTPDNVRHLNLLKWGLIPSWAKDASLGAKMINARSETAHTKPAFRSAFRNRRCLIPANGFYEWQEVEGKKIPYYIKLKDDCLMMFAGLWDHWKAPDGTVIESCTILTTTSNDLVAPLHNRMPVILQPSAYDTWLDPAITTPSDLLPLLQPYQSNLMVSYRVSTLVNIPRNDTPDLINPVQ